MTDVSLHNIAMGAAGVLFDREMQRVLENIQDPYTSTDQKRSISIKVTIEPNRDRDAANAVVEVSSKLAASVPKGTQLFLGAVETEDGTRMVARQVDIAQQELGFTPVLQEDKE